MPDSPQSVMVFAAGMGTRMGVLTRLRPKPLVEAGGVALVDHALRMAAEAGLGPVVVNTHYRAGLLARHLAPHRNVLISHEPGLLDTGGGLRAALPMLGPGPVFTVNSDCVWAGANPFAMLRAAWNAEQMDALLLLIPRRDARAHSGRGDFDLAADGRVTRGRDHVYSGVQIIRTEGLSRIGDRAFSLNRLWNAMAARGKLFGLVYQGAWCDAGSPAGLAAAEALLREKPCVRD